ncbi:hypothetical protein HDR61_01880 [bacterium]|nr:hypothetical protein [bacterium]
MAETFINQENLKQFQNWLLNLKTSDQPAYKLAQNLRFDLPLAVILDGAPTLPPLAQEVLAHVIAGQRGYQDQAADAKTLLDMAELQPILLGKVYAISGNSHSGHIYSKLLQELRKRPFEKNIPAIYAMMHFGPVYGSDAGIGDITKTSAQNTKILNKIFANSDSRSNRDQFRNSAYEFINSLDMSKLLNFAGASTEFRARINAANFNGWNNDKYDKMAKLNPELIDEQILANFINTPKPKQKDISDAKSQKEKNANILPISYTRPRDALLRLVERQEIHDPNNYGHEKTLTQRYNDLKTRMQKAKTWPAGNSDYETLARDVYRMVIQRDIIDGRAADLSPAELELALSADKDGFYVRKVPDSVLKKLNIRLNRRQDAIVSARNSTNPDMTVRLNKLSSADKRAAIERAQRTVAADAPMREQLNAELAAYDRDFKEVKLDSLSAQDANTVYTDMKDIQAAYKRIRDNFKDGAPNAQEAHLTTREMERAIYGYIVSSTPRKIDIPSQKSLPIFGRGTEQKRREAMENAINNFNKVLANVREHMNPILIGMWDQYCGAILNPDFLKHAHDEYNRASKLAESTKWEFDSTHRNRRTIESEQKQYAFKKEQLDNAKITFDQQQNQMRDMSRRHMGHDQTGELTPVTSDMTPEEKARAREKNRKTLNDPLAARKGKKPAKNLAEMLANADMDR